MYTLVSLLTGLISRMPKSVTKKKVKVRKIKKRSQWCWGGPAFCPSVGWRPLPAASFCSPCFSLCLFHSPLACVVSLIGRQTACKCSNPEKSRGALVIGCAPRHSSQSIKARWAPVNSFSPPLPWLWYCHTDSNFALNPPTADSPLSLCVLSFPKPPPPPPPDSPPTPNLSLRCCSKGIS